MYYETQDSSVKANFIYLLLHSQYLDIFTRIHIDAINSTRSAMTYTQDDVKARLVGIGTHACVMNRKKYHGSCARY